MLSLLDIGPDHKAPTMALAVAASTCPIGIGGNAPWQAAPSECCVHACPFHQALGV